MKIKHYYFWLGTNAELIKIWPVIKSFQQKGIPFKIIATGQNNLFTSKLFNQLRLTQQTLLINPMREKTTALGLLWWWIKTFVLCFAKLAKTPLDGKQSVVIIHGDTVSTLMGALYGRIRGAKVAHIEAGLRSFNWFSPFPEEINRYLVSLLARYHFAPNAWALANLASVVGEKINTKHNTLLESLLLLPAKVSLPENLALLNKNKFFIFVLHRQENLAKKDFLPAMINLIKKELPTDWRCLFIVHQNTHQALIDNGLLNILKKDKRFLLSSRLEYPQMIAVIKKAEFMLTDGGSNQEECYYLGKPCCILRSCTERQEGLTSNAILSGNHPEVISNFMKNYHQYIHQAITTKPCASNIISQYLKEKIN